MSGSLADRIRNEADLASRTGQWERLLVIAADIAHLEAEIARLTAAMENMVSVDIYQDALARADRTEAERDRLRADLDLVRQIAKERLDRALAAEAERDRLRKIADHLMAQGFPMTVEFEQQVREALAQPSGAARKNPEDVWWIDATPPAPSDAEDPPEVKRRWLAGRYKDAPPDATTNSEAYGSLPDAERRHREIHPTCPYLTDAEPRFYDTPGGQRVLAEGDIPDDWTPSDAE